jgi:hypothetical protein
MSAVMSFNPRMAELQVEGTDSRNWQYKSLMLSQHVVGYLANFVGDAIMVRSRLIHTFQNNRNR